MQGQQIRQLRNVPPARHRRVRLNPMKDGTAAGLFIGAKFAADGHTIGRWD